MLLLLIAMDANGIRWIYMLLLRVFSIDLATLVVIVRDSQTVLAIEHNTS